MIGLLRRRNSVLNVTVTIKESQQLIVCENFFETIHLEATEKLELISSLKPFVSH